MKAFLCVVSLLDLLLLGDIAFSQTAPAGQRERSADRAAESAAEATPEIVVTGSRIVRDGFESATPVTVLRADQLQSFAPSNIPDALNVLPQFQNSGSPTRYIQTNANVIAAGNYLNLRGVGTERTLILFDGHRVAPTNYTGTVDANVLPQMLVERVDVVTGGASSVYGSDAITGVVNYVLDKQYTGVKGLAQAGISRHGDNESGRFGIAAGAEVFERGHLLASVEHYQSSGIPSKCDRPFACDFVQLVGAGTAANPFMTVTNARMNFLTFGGLAISGPFAFHRFLPDGSLAPFDPGQPTGTGSVGIGGDGAWLGPGSLTGRLRTDQGYGRFAYDITDSTNVYLEARGSESRVSYAPATNFNFPFNTATIFSGNAFLHPSAQEQLRATNTSSFGAWQIYRDWGQTTADQLTNSFAVTAGGTGDVAGGWIYDVQITHGEGRVSAENGNIIHNQRFYAALDAVVAPGGNIVCNVTLTNPELYPNCVPINIMGEGAATAEVIDYVTGESKYKVTNKMDGVSLNLAGDLFSSSAGTAAASIGAEYRKQTLRQTSNSDPAIPVDFTGLRGVPPGQLTYQITNVGVAKGDYSIAEGYGEIAIPLLSNRPFADSLDLNAAVRYTDYSTSGGVTTWKIGAIYAPVEDLRLRVTRSRDIRAPSLFDLYAGLTSNITSFTDPHTGVNQVTTVTSGGNTDLKPEIGNTLTGGIIYQPRWASGLSLSLDFYDVKITDAIGSLGTERILLDCEASNGTAPICDNIVRPLPFSDTSPDNFPLSVKNVPVNVAMVHTRGADIELGYQTELSRLKSSWSGELSIRGIASYQPHYYTQQSFTQPVIDSGGTVANLGNGTTRPDWRGSLSVTYSNGPFRLFVQEEFIGSAVRTKGDTVFADPADNNVPEVFYTHLDASYDFAVDNRKITTFLNIHNVFDKKGPLLPFNALSTFVYPVPQGLYDVIGQSFVGGVRFEF